MLHLVFFVYTLCFSSMCLLKTFTCSMFNRMIQCLTFCSVHKILSTVKTTVVGIFQYDWSSGLFCTMENKNSEEIRTQRSSKETWLLRGNPTWKKITWRGERIYYFQEVTMNSVELYSIYNLFVPSSCLMGVQVYKYLACCNKSVDIMNLHNTRTYTLEFLHNCSDYTLDYWQWYVLSLVTTRARAGIVVTFKTWDDLAA